VNNDTSSSQVFDELFPDGPLVERLATGFKFTEGPIWHPVGQYLLFSDMPGDVRRRWTQPDGVSEVRRPSDKCNGMTYDAQLNLVVCEHSTSRVTVETPDGGIRVIASHYGGLQLNSPNDVVCTDDGSIYFSDPLYGRMPGFGVERSPELAFQGLYRIDPSGSLHLEADDFAAPNGLCQSPDGRLMYVNDTERAHIRVFDISSDGSLGNGRMFVEDIGTGDLAEGVPDGMKVDAAGNVYVTGPGGVWVIDSAGKHLGTIAVPEVVGNINWGAPDWQTLFICASTSLYSVRTAVSGAVSPYMRATGN
jgi:gluconolactonase